MGSSQYPSVGATGGGAGIQDGGILKVKGLIELRSPVYPQYV